MKAPSTIARTASLAESLAETPAAVPLAGRAKAKLWILLLFRVRTAAPASLRNSAAEKFLALPPPMRSRRLAFSPAGRCSSVVSNALPVTSPLAITSLAASRTAASAHSTDGAGLSFSLRSSLLLSFSPYQGPLRPGNRFPVETERRKRGLYSWWSVFSIHGGRGNLQLSRENLGGNALFWGVPPSRCFRAKYSRIRT